MCTVHQFVRDCPIAHAWSRPSVLRQPRLLDLGKLLFVDLDFVILAAQQLTTGPWPGNPWGTSGGTNLSQCNVQLNPDSQLIHFFIQAILYTKFCPILCLFAVSGTFSNDSIYFHFTRIWIALITRKAEHWSEETFETLPFIFND